MRCVESESRLTIDWLEWKAETCTSSERTLSRKNALIGFSAVSKSVKVIFLNLPQVGRAHTHATLPSVLFLMFWVRHQNISVHCVRHYFFFLITFLCLTFPRKTTVGPSNLHLVSSAFLASIALASIRFSTSVAWRCSRRGLVAGKWSSYSAEDCSGCNYGLSQVCTCG